MSETGKHYVDSYRTHVANMEVMFDHDEAMAVAVGGGDFTQVGDVSLGILKHFGLSAGQTLVDVGCGSGRLAAALTREYGAGISYLGLDVVDDLLDHARSVSDPSYRFAMNTELTIPAKDGSCDLIVFFSVVTHLLHEESFRYLRDSARTLKPGGRIVLTYLEARRHWSIFQRVVDIYDLPQVNEPLVMFIEHSTLEMWAEKLSLEFEETVPFDPPGQSVAAFRRPAR